MARYAKGEQIRALGKNEDRFFDSDNAKDDLANAY